MIKERKKDSKEISKILLDVIGGSRTFNGTILGFIDTANVIITQRLWMGILWDCQDRFRQSVLFGRFNQIVHLINDVDVYELLKTCDLLNDLLLDSTNSRHLRRGLKARMKHAIRDVAPSTGGFVTRLLGLLKSDLQAWTTNASPKSLRILHQTFAFQGRLPLEAANSIGSALQKWWACETASVNHDFSKDPEVAIISKWFSRNPLDDPENFFPAHPSGACIETSKGLAPKSLAGKYACFRNLDEKCFKLLLRLGYLDSDLSNLDGSGGLMQNPFGQLQYEGWEGPRPARLIDLVETTERLMAPVVGSTNGYTAVELKDVEWFATGHLLQDVPKNWKTKRLISMETAIRMWLQTGVKEHIFSILKRKMSPLALHYMVNTEYWNQLQSCEGSCTGQQATTDLSSASDCVRHKLVQKWFEKSGLSEVLELCRSDITLIPIDMYADPDSKGKRTEARDKRVFAPDDMIHWKTQKYMPMGGAICFPVEVIVFAAILENLCAANEGMFRDYKVYGDDCVHDVALTELFHERLRELGFIPNPDKSFYNEPTWDDDDVFFRESCGAEWLNGVDVAPARLTRKFAGFADPSLVNKEIISQRLSRIKRPSARKAFKARIKDKQKEQCKKIVAEISLANSFYERNLPTARAIVLHHLLDECGLALPFSGTDPSKLLSNSPTNFHLKDYRWNFELQRFEVRCVVPTVRNLRKGSLEAGVLLFEDLRAMKQYRKTLREGYSLTKAMPPEELRLTETDPRNQKFELKTTWIECEVVPAEYAKLMTGLVSLSIHEYTDLANAAQL